VEPDVAAVAAAPSAESGSPLTSSVAAAPIERVAMASDADRTTGSAIDPAPADATIRRSPSPSVASRRLLRRRVVTRRARGLAAAWLRRAEQWVRASDLEVDRS
jgi:hypothetical protein